MPALVCPHCGTYANFRHQWSRDARDKMDDGWTSVPPSACFTCDKCQYPIIAMMRDWSMERIETYWPTKPGKKDFPHVPKPIASAANEAHICLAAGSRHGAVALARAVVESVAKNKGITKDNLEKRIDGLYGAGHIGEDMKEAAHEIRFAGNEAAHGDLVAEALSIEDAEGIVGLMDTILERVYQVPAKVALIRQRRVNRKARPPSVEEDPQASADYGQRPAEDPWTADPSDGFGGDGAPDEPPF